MDELPALAINNISGKWEVVSNMVVHDGWSKSKKGMHDALHADTGLRKSLTGTTRETVHGRLPKLGSVWILNFTFHM